MNKEQIDENLTQEAIKVSAEITNVLNKFHDIDIAERSVLVTKLFPVFMRVRQKAQDEILDILEIWDKPKWEFIKLMRNRKDTQQIEGGKTR